MFFAGKAIFKNIQKENIAKLKLSINYNCYNNNLFNNDFNYVVEDISEYAINCGVFVIALCKTFYLELINLSTWPIINRYDAEDWFEDWFRDESIAEEHHENYYKNCRGVRGIHVLCSTYTVSSPSEYKENITLISVILNNLLNLP